MGLRESASFGCGFWTTLNVVSIQHVLFIHELHAIHMKQIPQVGASQLFCFSSVSLSMTSDFWLMLRSTSNRPDLELCHLEKFS